MRQDIFATPVWHIEGAPQQLVDELYEKVSIIKKKKDLFNLDKHYKLHISNQEGYQTSQFEWQAFHPVGKEYIDKVINDIFINYLASVSGWWYNINPQGAWNTPHNHGGSNYVLLWYLTDSDGLLKLMNPQSNRIDSVMDKSFNTKKGDILIFPADIIHYVMPNTKETDRVSISMNLHLCGK